MIPAIYSTLGSNSSLVPLAVKDIANSIGLTTGSYITGNKLEGKDRFIDEFGTQALWLFGIPAYKKLIDLTLYKLFKIDPKFDVRNLSQKNILDKSVSYADVSIKESMKKAVKNPKFTKNLTLAKFGISTLLTIVSYMGLTKFKHNQTRKSAEKEILSEIKQETAKKEKLKTPKAFEGVHNITFTGGFSDFIFNPVKNLMILDGAITAERLSNSRNKQEFIGYTIKEGTFWAFMYFASAPIQKFLEKSAEKKHNKSIDLDSRVIESPELEKAFKNGELKKSVNKVLTADNNEKLLEYLHFHPDDFTVKMAKKSDIIPTLKKASQADNTDYRKFIDLDSFKATAEKLKKLYNEYKSSGQTVEEFLNAVKKLKRKSVLKNIGSCIGVLGVIAPAIMVLLRKADKNNQGFQVKEDLRKELIASAAK